MIIPTYDEFFTAKVYHRKPNTYDYEETPYATFKCKIASQMERKSYRITKGVHGKQDSIYLYASNLPSEVRVDDRVEFLGELKILKTVGYYYNDSLIVNPSVFSNEYIFKNSPKGISVE